MLLIVLLGFMISKYFQDGFYADPLKDKVRHRNITP